MERRRIDEEIADIHKQLRGGGSPAPAQTKAAPKKGGLSAAGRKALSDAMKKRWAVKKKAGKPAK